MDGGDGTTLERLRRLARHLAAFEEMGFQLGRWEPARRREDGVVVMGWFVPGPEAEAFFADAGAWVTPFDWQAWLETDEGRRLSSDPAAVADAGVECLARLLTALVRAQRFNDASWEGAHESGLLVAVMRRAAVLAAALERATDGPSERLGQVADDLGDRRQGHQARKDPGRGCTGPS